MGEMLSADKLKNLPFKPTALFKKKPAPKESSALKEDGKLPSKDRDDGLELFQRSNEMKATLEADRLARARRAKKKREKEEASQRKAEQIYRHPSSSPIPEKRPSPDADDAVAGDEEDAFYAAPMGSSSTNIDSKPELATPPPSKRTRTEHGSSVRSSTRTRSSRQAPFGLDASPSTRRAVATEGSSSAPFVLDSDPEDSIPAPTSKRRRSSSVELVSESNVNPNKDEEDEEEKYIQLALKNRAKLAAQMGPGSNGKSRKVDIIVDSPIEGSKTCQIRYFFDKPLLRVRQAWIQKQQGTEMPDPSQLVLTWRNTKVYNNSTLLDLGIRPWGDVGVFADGGSSAGLDGSRVHLQIWTVKLLDDYIAAENARRRHDLGEFSDDEDDYGGQSREPEVEERKLKITLRARDYEEVRLTVRPETTVETLTAGFRTQRSIPTNKQITLRFDGEELEEHVTLEDADVDDMDTIEVYVK